MQKQKFSYIGVVDKIRVINSFPEMLVRFTLKTQTESINCLVGKKELANLILFLDEGKYEVSIYGHYNSRDQLVVEKFFIRNADSFINEFVVKPMNSTA